MTATSLIQHTQVVPAQLSFLAIYNPSLGPTDETFADQVVFWYSRADNEARAAAKKKQQHGVTKREDKKREDELREQENEKLRQVGLAQGMVDFARSFSEGDPVDSVETEKSRIVLHLLETGWWILASIDLTRLPAASPATTSTSSKGSAHADKKPEIEYSSREVSPPALLIQQLLQGHFVFSLHHGPSLSDLWVKQSRDKFCGALDRFWGRFARNWDVLLHGNPAADIFSGIKLASGGELGFGVGEEEWGSGEREVVEDLAHRTEGLVDLVVARFGEPASNGDKEVATAPESEALPWMGTGSQPIASDGVIFSGVGAISRPSLRNVSLWMRDLYTHGEYAYGVRDNPQRERRRRRQRDRPAPTSEESNGGAHAPRRSRQLDAKDLRQKVQQQEATKQEKAGDLIDAALLPRDSMPQLHDRVASHDHARNESVPQVASHPGVSPPIISATEQALDRATQQASRTGRPDELQGPEAENSNTTLGIPDQYMKYLTFGLSTLAKPSKPQRAQSPKRTSRLSPKTLRQRNISNSSQTITQSNSTDAEDEQPSMFYVDSIPDGDALQAKIAGQKHLEDKGHFLIGLTGELNAVLEEEDVDLTQGSLHDDTGGSRTVLRTLQIEVLPTQAENEEGAVEQQRALSSSSMGAAQNVRRLRVLVYVHRPFMYCFLFEQRTASLSYSSFYRSLHRNLTPIHKPLLTSTNAGKVAQRIEASQATQTAGEQQAETASVGSRRNRLPPKLVQLSPIFDLLYDPARLTVHTSVPNIPDPGTPAAEGLMTSTSRMDKMEWTRIEALNVHSTILNTLVDIREFGGKGELERSSKTSRGWWVVWMKLQPSTPTTFITEEEHGNTEKAAAEASSTAPIAGGNGDGGDVGGPPLAENEILRNDPELEKDPKMCRIAFLVRKASDGTAATKSGASSRSAASGRMWSSLGLGVSTTAREERFNEGKRGSAGSLVAGMGMDARKYVEGLLSLNR